MSARKRRPRVPAPLELGEARDGLAALRLCASEVELGNAELLVRTGGRAMLTPRGARELAAWLDAYCGRALPPLIGPKGIMAEHGVSRRTVDNWRGRRDFPAAVPVEGGTETVWEAEAVREWVEAHRPRAGHPPRSDH